MHLLINASRIMVWDPCVRTLVKCVCDVYSTELILEVYVSKLKVSLF